MLVPLAALDSPYLPRYLRYPRNLKVPHLSSASRLGPTLSVSPLFTLDDLPRNAAAPVSGVICLLTDEEVPSLAARMLA